MKKLHSSTLHKILALLLSAVLFFGGLPVSVFAEEGGDDIVVATSGVTNGGLILDGGGENCVCTAFCDDPDCPVCKDDATQCFFYYCVCEALCGEDSINTDCPICKDDYASCVLAVEVPEIAAAAWSSSMTANTFTELQTAINDFNSSATGDTTITVTANFAVTTVFTITNTACTLTIKSDGTHRKLTRTATGALFTVKNGAKLTLENITLDGNNASATTNRLVYVEIGGECTIKSGTVLQNNILSGTNSGSAVYVIGGAFNMEENCIIQNNQSGTGGSTGSSGGVSVQYGGTFNMTGGTISGNTAIAACGGVAVSDSTFNMSGGTITGNTAGNYGGGVYLNGGVFAMTSGTISGNTAGYGGGVYIGGGTFAMSGGIISGNITDGDGGGVYVDSGTFAMTGGIISGNITDGDGGGVRSQSNGTFTMNGGEIKNNIAGGRGGGVDASGDFIMNGGEISDNECDGDENGGGVWVWANNYVIIGGDAIIKNNTSGSVANNLFLCYDYITLGTGANGADAPTSDMEIHVTLSEDYPNGDVIVQSGADETIKSYFHSDDTTKQVVLDGDALKLANTYWYDDGIRATSYSVPKSGTTLTISNAAELGLFAYELENYEGEGENGDYDGWTVKLADNINLSGNLWYPVNMYNVDFDGNNKKISNLTVNDYATASSASAFAAGMFGELNISTVRNLTLENPVIDVNTNNISAGSIAGTTYGAQIRNVVVNNPTVKSRVYGMDMYILGGIVGSAWPSDEQNSVGLYMTIINGAEVNGGEICLDLSLYDNDSSYAYWHNGDCVYLGGIAGENYDSNIASANVSSTVITIENNVGQAVNMDTLCVGGIAGYTSATAEAYRACLLNDLSMADIQIPADVDASTRYVGGICGQVYNDSVVNNLYIGGLYVDDEDEYYGMFGNVNNDDLGDETYRVECNYAYADVDDAFSTPVPKDTSVGGDYVNVYEALSDVTPDTGGMWKAAAVTDEHTGYGQDVSLTKYKVWEVNPNTKIPSHGDWYAPPNYGISLNPATNKTFTAATYGYSAQTAHSVTVTNTGNQPTGALTVALSGASSGSFTLSKTSINSIAVSGNDSFTVVPNTGLAAGTYTATVTVSGGNSISATFDVSFEVTAAPPTGKTDAEKVADDKAALTFDSIKGSNADADNITDNLTLPNTGANGSTITWSSTPSGYVGDDGTVTRPANGAGDKTVTLTATITNGSASDTVTFTLTVKQQPAPPTGKTDAEKVVDDLNALTFNDIKNQNVTERDIASDLTLITTGKAYSSAITWASSNASIIGTDGKVTKPADSDKTVTLTATVTNGTASGTKTFTLTVKKAPASTGGVGGTVTDDGGTARDGYTVKIMTGGTNGTLIGTTLTASGGKYSFTGLPYGVYSLVVYDGTNSVTRLIKINALNITEDVQMPSGNQNTQVVVEGSDTPSVAVENLEDVFTADDITAAQTGSVEIKLVVEAVTNPSDANIVLQNIGGKELGFYLDAKLIKTVTGNTGGGTADGTYNIQPGTPLTIVIDVPPELQNMAPYSIIRVHNGIAATIPATYDSTLHILTFQADAFSTYALAYTKPGGGGGGSSSGGGGGGGTGATVVSTYWIEVSEAKAMAKAAKEKKLDYVRSRRATITGIRKDALLTLTSLRYRHDTVVGNEVQVRVYINDPSKAVKDILVSGYVTGDTVDTVKVKFQKWFTNKLAVVSLEQQGDFGMQAEIAAKVNLSDMDTNSLYFYSYDKTLNKYTRIQTEYKIDANGYLHFATILTGDIIVSNGPIERKTEAQMAADGNKYYYSAQPTLENLNIDSSDSMLGISEPPAQAAPQNPSTGGDSSLYMNADNIPLKLEKVDTKNAGGVLVIDLDASVTQDALSDSLKRDKVSVYVVLGITLVLLLAAIMLWAVISHKNDPMVSAEDYRKKH